MVKNKESVKELISVIVPVYKVEEYLRECIDSILANTYKKLEIILVDDGSPDESGKICDEYEKKDKRVFVIHQENRGLVGARNTGLRAAHGEYISFIDSDDVISPAFFECMIKELWKNEVDMVACESCRKKELLASNPEYSVCEMENYEEKIALITSAPSVRNISWTGCNVWNKLYRKNKIQHFFREECIMCEDLRFNYDYIQNCNKIITLSQPLYYYRDNENSIMGHYRKDKGNVVGGIRHAQVWEQLAEENLQNKELDLYLKVRAAYMAHGAIWRIYKNKKENQYSEYICYARKQIKSSVKDLQKDTDSYNLKIKLIIWIYSYMFPIWILLNRIF